MGFVSRSSTKLLSVVSKVPISQGYLHERFSCQIVFILSHVYRFLFQCFRIGLLIMNQQTKSASYNDMLTAAQRVRDDGIDMIVIGVKVGIIILLASCIRLEIEELNGIKMAKILRCYVVCF